ncbi:MAG: AAA family ATPase [Acidobacteria bacterium]|nr:AAA family ATPase [Acidobacteriota bacterium]
MKTLLASKSELTPAQARVIEMSATENRVIFGVVGTGKTQLLLHRARYLSDSLKVPSNRYHIFVHNNVLKTYLRSSLALLNIPETALSTFNSWCLNFYRYHINTLLPENHDKTPQFDLIRKGILGKIKFSDNSSFFDNIFHSMLNIVRSNTITMPIYDFVLVDDGQELDSISIDIISTIARHVTIVADDKHKINTSGLSSTELLIKLKQRYSLHLNGAFRSSPFIINLAAQFIDDLELRKNYLFEAKTPEGEKETPVLYYAANALDEKNKLIEVMRNRLIKGENVAVLLFNDNQVNEFAEALKDPRLEVKKILSSPRSDGSLNKLDFSNDCPKLITFQNAQGLTFDTVIIPQLINNGHFKTLAVDQVQKILFSAITRATKWVFLSTHNADSLPLLSKITPLKEQGMLNIQTFVPRRMVKKFTVPTHIPAETDDLIDIL